MTHTGARVEGRRGGETPPTDRLAALSFPITIFRRSLCRIKPATKGAIVQLVSWLESPDIEILIAIRRSSYVFLSDGYVTFKTATFGLHVVLNKTT